MALAPLFLTTSYKAVAEAAQLPEFFVKVSNPSYGSLAILREDFETPVHLMGSTAMVVLAAEPKTAMVNTSREEIILEG